MIKNAPLIAVLLLAGVIAFTPRVISLFETPQPNLPILGKAPSFELTKADGSKFASSSLAGKWHVVNFFFASCPHVCPAVNGRVSLVHKEFAKKGIEFVSISVDPETDTPAALTEYWPRFTESDEHWHFLTHNGMEDPMKGLAAVLEQGYFLPISEDKNNHTTRLVLIDPEGQIRGYYRGLSDNGSEELAEVLSTLTS